MFFFPFLEDKGILKLRNVAEDTERESSADVCCAKHNVFSINAK